MYCTITLGSRRYRHIYEHIVSGYLLLTNMKGDGEGDQSVSEAIVNKSKQQFFVTRIKLGKKNIMSLRDFVS